MAGLLDAFNNDSTRFSLGLLAAAAPRKDNAGFGERVQEALDGVEKNRLYKQKLDLQQMQMDAYRTQAEQAAKLAALPGQFMRPATAPQEITQTVPYSPDQQTSLTQGKPASFDYNGYAGALAGIDPMAALDLQTRLGAKKAPIKLGQGETLLNPDNFTPLYSAPTKPEATPSAIQEYEYAKKQGYGGTFEQWDTARKRAGASSVSVNTGQKGFDNTLKLRGDFRSEPIYKAHQEVQSAYAQIQQGLKMQSPAGDLAGATKVMKLLDPGSVVRESELGMAMAATGLMDRLENYATNVLKGTKLTPLQRKDFQTLADNLFNESAKQYNGKRGEYEAIANRNGLAVPDVVGEPSKPAATMRWNPATGKLEQVK